MTDITNSHDLLSYIVSQASSGQKNWFGFQQQRIIGIHVAYEIAKAHADTMTPKQITSFVKELNNSVYIDLVKGE